MSDFTSFGVNKLGFIFHTQTVILESILRNKSLKVVLSKNMYIENFKNFFDVISNTKGYAVSILKYVDGKYVIKLDSYTNKEVYCELIIDDDKASLIYGKRYVKV